MANKFKKDQVVMHRKGGVYLISEVPNGRLLESSGEEFYEYICAKSEVTWVRAKSEMEDGRFLLTFQ